MIQDFLHSEYTTGPTIKVPPHIRVATLSFAAPDKVHEEFSTVDVLLQCLISNWEGTTAGWEMVDIDFEKEVFKLTA